MHNEVNVSEVEVIHASLASRTDQPVFLQGHNVFPTSSPLQYFFASYRQLQSRGSVGCSLFENQT